jgi:GT2 family glycosyltransferase
MTVSVVIVTLNRPECMQRCLECLRAQQPCADEVFVVDASADERTAEVVRAFPEVVYLRTDVGYGHMTKSRNLGLSMCAGDVIAFIDDDAFVHDGWLGALLEPYADPAIGGVGGRALNNQPGEATAGIGQIGRLLPDGTITGNFAADPGRVLEVDHLIGCNMSWRASVLRQLGGLRDDYPGTEVREETDIALRVRRLGYRLVYQPAAVVTHVGAPQAKGRRFDTRYAYYHARNHAMLVVRNYGPMSRLAVRSAVREVGEMFLEVAKRLGVAGLHLAARAAGLSVGTGAGLVRYARERGDPTRHPAVPDRSDAPNNSVAQATTSANCAVDVGQ